MRSPAAPSALRATPPPYYHPRVHLADQRLGIYHLEAELGRGGMGAVFRAVAEAEGPAGPPGAVVAVKVFHDHLAQDERLFERFRREAEIGRSISHPHLVRTFALDSEVIEGSTVHYMVMEFIEGQTLAGLVRELGTVPEHLRLQIADQMLDALAAIHAQGIVHRDIKPENVVITPDHRVLIMDLGIARLQESGHTLTERGEFVGSVAYAAPEQFSGEQSEIGPPADIYALGLVLYSLSTGDNPFSGADLMTVLQKKLVGNLPPPRLASTEIDPFWNEVIVTATQKKVADRFASADEMRRVLREGEEGAWWQIRARRAGRPTSERAFRRLQLAREAPLIGRDAVLDDLWNRYSRAAEAGAALLVGGRSGVGKSRVLYEFLRRIEAEGTALITAGRCVGSEGRAYQPFIEALGDLLLPNEADPEERRAALEKRLRELLPETPGIVTQIADFLLGDIQPGVDGALSRDAIFAACARLVQRAAAERPLILVVEDLHWAGSESVELFRYVARGLADAAVLLVGVYSDDELGDGDPLHGLLSAPRQEEVERILVASLDESAVEDLVRAIVGVERTVRSLARPLHVRAEGNPYLVLEMLTQLRADGALVERQDEGLDLARPVAVLEVPATAREVVSLKLGRLDEDERETLEAAAVIGRDFDAALLAAVLDQNRIHLLKRLAVLERKHRLVVSAGKGRLRFASHPVYQAVYEAIQPDLREAIHEVVADTIASQLEDGEEPQGAVAFALLRHLFHAGRVTEAEPYLEAALDAMAATFHASYAIPFLEKIADAFQGAEPRKRLAIAMKQWAFYDLIASRKDQMHILEEAQGLAEQADMPDLRARVHALRAGSYWYTGDYARASEEARTGLELARAAENRKWEATCHHTLGAVAYRRGDLTTCAREMREALRIRREVGDRRGEASTLQALALVMPSIGETDRVLPTMEEALQIWREVGERRGEAAVTMNIGIRLVDDARYEEGLAYLEQAIAAHRETGALLSEAMALANLGRAHEVLGRLDEARAAWDRALALFTDLGDPNGQILVRTMLGSALATAGAHAEARSQLEGAIALAESQGAKAKLVAAHCEMGRLLGEMGDHMAGSRHLETALALAKDTGSLSGCVRTLSALGHSALVAGDVERAVAYLAEALPDALRGDAAPAALVLTRYALALQAAGRAQEATSRAREARELIARSGDISVAYGGEIFRGLAQILGDDEGRAELLERARLAEATRAGSTAGAATRVEAPAGDAPTLQTRLTPKPAGGASKAEDA